MAARSEETQWAIKGEQMENKPVRPLTAAEQQLLQNVLLELLAAQIVRFTAGERSSVPAETAQELMASLCMTLDIQNPARARQLLHGDAGAALVAGQKHLQYRWALCRQLWQRAADTAPVWQNLALRETLESIGQSVTAKARPTMCSSLPMSCPAALTIHYAILCRKPCRARNIWRST